MGKAYREFKERAKYNGFTRLYIKPFEKPFYINTFKDYRAAKRKIQQYFKTELKHRRNYASRNHLKMRELPIIEYHTQMLCDPEAD